MAQIPDTSERLTIQQVAGLMRITRQTLWSWRRDGVGPKWYRIVGRVVYLRSDLAEWFAAQAGRAVAKSVSDDPNG